MKKTALIFTFMSIFIIANQAWSQGSSVYEEQFKVLTEKNIFSINRMVGKIVPIEREDLDEKPKPKKYSSYILIGVSSINGQWNAFFENIINGHCQIVKISDEFEGGIVEKIDSTGVSFKRGEDMIELVIGADMKGQTEVPVESEAELNDSSSGDSPPASEEAGGGSLLQKLLERRNKQLK